jgi:hypothetical protein
MATSGRHETVSVVRRLPKGISPPSDGQAGIGIAFAADEEGNFSIHSLHPEGSAYECGRVRLILIHWSRVLRGLTRQFRCILCTN